MEAECEVEHRLDAYGGKPLGVLSNSELAFTVEDGSKATRGKLGSRKGNNPDRS